MCTAIEICSKVYHNAERNGQQAVLPQKYVNVQGYWQSAQRVNFRVECAQQALAIDLKSTDVMTVLRGEYLGKMEVYYVSGIVSTVCRGEDS